MVSQLGRWAFIIGAILAIIMGIGAGLAQAWAANIWLMLLLLIAGLIVGFVNITAKEIQPFLIASIAVFAAAAFANLIQIDTLIAPLGGILKGMVDKVIFVIAPAALIVALRAVYGFAAE